MRARSPAHSSQDNEYDDEDDDDEEIASSSRQKKSKLGKLPAAFLSISAFAHDRPSNSGGTSTPVEDNEPPPEDEPDVEHHETPEFTSDIKRRLWLLMEQPSSGSAAFWTNVIVSVLIVLSAVMTTIETIPAFRSAESNRVWFNLETVMVALFTLEYLLRVFAHSDSMRMLLNFFFSPIPIIDFIAVMPFYVELIARRDTTYEFRFTILRLFRLLRLFKSYKYSNAIIMTIEVMVVALRRSSDALSALFFFLVTCVVLFSTLLYFAERGVWDESLETFVDPDGNPSSFDSIPAAFWFVLVTITTTGYGDMVPATFIGKLVTFPAMMFGVLLIALPSIIVGRNFTIVWEAMRRRQYYSELMTNENEDPADGIVPEQHDATMTAAHQQQQSQNPLSPPRHGFDILDNSDDAIMRELQTLMMITRQNSEAIQHILSILEKQEKHQQHQHQHQHQPAHQVPEENKGKSVAHRSDAS
ncbi:hypothetical protein BCR43DRAFT_440718 [Syncephalastrum racemosum]|uniref:Ion transport domain-containing protein n=1 Tax=Syncephalastrum racemosum TaxID=13706 RepID=A0A1X2HB60_SYNRA|nr:hypothetical protein BCR43DRAFT_440718 [Syncephalastrum racemosum]